MDDRLAAHISEVINWHRTWIKALDYGTYLPVVSKSLYYTRKQLEPAFRLEVRVGMYGYRRGKIISVPYTQISRAISKLIATDSGMNSRIVHQNLIYQDIIRIFKLATWNAINLDLEE